MASVERQIEGQGVPEHEWEGCGWLQALPAESAATLLAGSARLVVVSPHPDDEVLACGGLMASASALGIPVMVISVTDGEACYPDEAAWPPRVLRQARQKELEQALHKLGLADAERRAWHIGDGEVAAAEAQIGERLHRLLRSDDLVLAPWRLDGHPDHEAVGRACVQAAAARGSCLREYPVWGWHWLDPALAHSAWSGAARYPLAPGVVARKRAAIEAFATQTGAVEGLASPPILPAHVLQRFHRNYEVLLA